MRYSLSFVSWPDQTTRKQCASFENSVQLNNRAGSISPRPDGPMVSFVLTAHTLGVGSKKDRFLYRCGQCKRDTSPTAGTAMPQSKILVQDGVWAAYMVATPTPGLSATQLHRYLGTSSYKTAWYLLQRLRRAMVNDTRTP